MKKWVAPALFSLAGLVVSLFVYADLPESMAIHFGPGGNPDRFVTRPVGAFLAPALIWILSILVVVSPRYRQDESKRRRAESAQQAILAIVGAFLLGMHLFTLAYNLGYEINPVKYGSVAVGLMFMLFGNLSPRLAQAGFLRVWPKLSPEAERAYGRFQGRLMVGAGFVFILLAPLPDKIHGPVFFALLMMFILTMYAALFRYRRKAG